MDTATIPSPTEFATQASNAVPAVQKSAQGFPVAPAEAPMNRAAPAIVLGQPKLTEAIANVMAEIEAVRKGGTNEFHKYQYARMQDILQQLTPLIGKHGIVLFQTEHERTVFDQGNVIAIQYRFTITHKSGEVWPEQPLQTGMSYCRDSRGKFDDKSLNKCHTAARKYFLLSLFQVPTGDAADVADADIDDVNQDRVPSPSGRREPYKIPTVRGETAKSWAAKYEAAIKGASSLDDLKQWDAVNDGLLEELALKSPDISARIAQMFDRRTNELRGSAVPPIVRPAASPDPDKDPDGFLKWADERMATIDDSEKLEEDFNVVIDVASKGLFPPDHDELVGIYERHMRKFEG